MPCHPHAMPSHAMRTWNVTGHYIPFDINLVILTTWLIFTGIIPGIIISVFTIVMVAILLLVLLLLLGLYTILLKRVHKAFLVLICTRVFPLHCCILCRWAPEDFTWRSLASLQRLCLSGVWGDLRAKLDHLAFGCHHLAMDQVALCCAVHDLSKQDSFCKIRWKQRNLKWTHCGPVTPYAISRVGRHWFKWWLVAWWHNAITCTNVNL